MTGRSRALLLALVLIAAIAVVQGANSAGRPTCLVSNERTGVGYRSLQDAIDAAAAGDTLVVKGTCFGHSAIGKSLTLKGVSNKPFGSATLDGSGSDGTVLALAAPCCTSIDLEIEDLTITHAGSDGIFFGGYQGHMLRLTRTTVSDNNGSGITGQFGRTTLIDSVVSGNAHGGLGGSRMSFTLIHSNVRDNGAFGIGVGRVSDASLTDSTVSGNDSGGIGLASFGDSSLEVTGSTITANDGWGITAPVGSVVLTDSTVSENSTSGSGGGIYGNARLFNTWVTGNTAGVDGGGIYVPALATVTLTNSTVSGNTAGGNGGGIYVAGGTSMFGDNLTLTDSTVSGNTATSGGGIFNLGTTTLLGTNTFANNIPDNCVGVTGC